MNEVFRRLERLLRRLVATHLALRCAAAIAGAGLVLIVATAFDRIAPVREAVALRVVVALLVLLALSLAGAVAWTCVLRRTTLRQVARRIEDAHPELFDSLNCAVELMERRGGGGPAALLERRLEDDALRRMAGLPFERSILPARASTGVLAVVASVACALFALALGAPLARKAWAHLADRWLGADSGLHVWPESAEAPVGSDLEIAVAVNRWERRLEVCTRTRAGVSARFPVVLDESGCGRFRLYDLRERIEFDVVTPSLESRGHTVDVYTPPELRGVTMNVRAPAYARVPERKAGAFEDARMIEGGEIDVVLEVAPACSAEMQIDGAVEASPGGIASRHRFVARPARTASLRFAFCTADGRPMRTGARRVEVIPDAPPLVEIVRPGEDVAAEPGASLTLGVFAADDLGLGGVRLHLSVSGRVLADRVLHAGAPAGGGAPARELRFDPGISLADLKLVDGDVLSYWASARDLREPEAQESRSAVFFVEIRERKEPTEVDAGAGKPREVDLRAFVVEFKRLLRETHDAGARPAERRVPRLRELGVGYDEAARRLDGVRAGAADALAAMGQGALDDTLGLAVRDAQAASRAAAGGRAADAIAAGERALSRLVTVENALRRNVVSRKNDGGQGREGKAGGGKDPAGSPGNDPAARVREWARELERLIDEQGALNFEMDRAVAASPAAGAMAAHQEDLRRRTGELRGRMFEEPPGAHIGMRLRAAEQEMGAAGAALGATPAVPGAAHRRGMAAREQLVGAADLLEGALAHAAALALDELGAQAAELAGRERATAGRSAGDEGAPGGDRAAEQRAINGAVEGLAAGLDGVAGRLAEDNPEAGHLARSAAAQARGPGIHGRMARATNALLYGRHERAAELQREAAAGLDAVAATIGEARARLDADAVPGADTVAGRVRLNRRAAAPPEKYREDVERYFRSLAEEP